MWEVEIRWTNGEKFKKVRIVLNRGVRDTKARLTQEDISIEAHSFHLFVSGLVDKFGEVSPHTGIDSLPHLRRQRPSFLLVFLQGLPNELQTQGPKVS